MDLGKPLQIDKRPKALQWSASLVVGAGRSFSNDLHPFFATILSGYVISIKLSFNQRKHSKYLLVLLNLIPNRKAATPLLSLSISLSILSPLSPLCILHQASGKTEIGITFTGQTNLSPYLQRQHVLYP